MDAIVRYYNKVVSAWLKRERRARWFSTCYFVEQGNMSNLEFRLYWGVPAWVFYKCKKRHQAMKDGKVKIKFKRYSKLSP